MWPAFVVEDNFARVYIVRVRLQLLKLATRRQMLDGRVSAPKYRAAASAPSWRGSYRVSSAQ